MDLTREQIRINCCRICIVKKGTVGVGEIHSHSTSIAEMISQLASVVVECNDSFPCFVCSDCVERIVAAFHLKLECEKSELKFQEIFGVRTVSEVKRLVELDTIHNNPPEHQLQAVYIKDESGLTTPETAVIVEYHDSSVIIKSPLEDDNDDDVKTVISVTEEDLEAIMENQDDFGEDFKTEEEVMNIDGACEEASSSSSSADKRVDEDGGEEAVNLSCELCSRKFQYRASLSNHMRVHKAVPHKCNVCGKEFKLRQNLNNHVRTHTGEKPFECDICHKKFSTKSNIFNHRKTHSDDKPYICDVCGKQFPTISHLRNHNLSHVPIAERKYKCDKCNKTFRDRKIYKRHLNLHNGIRNEMCEICGKKFCNKNDVTRHHKTVHLGIKKYVCSVCSKAFSNSSNLESHFRIHTGEKPFECKYCDAKFNQSTPLVKHTKLHIERGDAKKTVQYIPKAEKEVNC